MSGGGIPDGFKPHFRKSALTDPWEPLYSRIDEGRVRIGFVAAANHCNSRGFVHGGLLSALADNALGLSCAGQHDPVKGLATINLNLTFLRPVRVGDWVEIVPTFTRIGRSVDAAEGHIEAGGKRSALVTATFAVPAD
jgi:uncharacterized protein (TIGR00369 family)